jgi:hypothetical protein
MSVGDVNLRARRPSVAGANTQVLFNQSGVEGASPNLTFDGVNLTVSGTNVVSSINVALGVAANAWMTANSITPALRVLAANGALANTDTIIYQNSATLFALFVPDQTAVPFTRNTTRIEIIVGKAAANIVLAPNTNVTLLTVNSQSGFISNTVAATGNVNLTANSISTVYLVEPFSNVWMCRTTV